MNDIQQVMKEAREDLEKATPGPWKVIEQVWEEDKPFLAERHIVTAYDHPQLKSYDSVVCMSHCIYEPKQRVYIDEHDAHLIANAPTYISTLLSAYEEAQREIERLNRIQETLKEAVSAIVSEGRKDKLKADEWTESVVKEARQLRTEHVAMKEALEWYASGFTYDIERLTENGCSVIYRNAGRKARSALSSLSKEDSNETPK